MTEIQKYGNKNELIPVSTKKKKTSEMYFTYRIAYVFMRLFHYFVPDT